MIDRAVDLEVAARQSAHAAVPWWRLRARLNGKFWTLVLLLLAIVLGGLNVAARVRATASAQDVERMSRGNRQLLKRLLHKEDEALTVLLERAPLGPADHARHP